MIVAIYVVYSRNLRRKNLALYNQIQENTRAEKEAAEALETIPEEKLSREKKLFRDLNRRMVSEKLFTDPALDRQSLPSLMGSNDKYIGAAVREGAGTTVANYISDLRLAYSITLLSENPDMPLDTIAEESGHSSYSAFFRAFVKRYGMGPAEYRKLSMTGRVEKQDGKQDE